MPAPAELPRAGESDWYTQTGPTLLHEEVAAVMVAQDEPVTMDDLREATGISSRELVTGSLADLQARDIIELTGTRRRLTPWGVDLFLEHAEAKQARVAFGLEALAREEDPRNREQSNTDPLYRTLASSNGKLPTPFKAEIALAIALGRRRVTGTDPAKAITAFTGYYESTVRTNLPSLDRAHLLIPSTAIDPTTHRRNQDFGPTRLLLDVMGSHLVRKKAQLDRALR